MRHEAAKLPDRLEPADAAEHERVLRAVGDRLARSRTVPADVRLVVRRFARMLAATEPAAFAELEPAAGFAVYRAVLDAVLAAGEPRAERGDVAIAIEQIRQVFAGLAEGPPAAGMPRDVAAWLASAVEVPHHELARLVGASTRTFQRWLSEAAGTAPLGDDLARLRVVARAVAHLRHALTPSGVVAWFDRGNAHLGGRTPRSVLADPSRAHEIVRAAAALASGDYW
ncbi:MAG TPA: hypothetical protein VGB64_12790 [Actinomycetota bacterium]